MPPAFTNTKGSIPEEERRTGDTLRVHCVVNTVDCCLLTPDAFLFALRAQLWDYLLKQTQRHILKGEQPNLQQDFFV